MSLTKAQQVFDATIPANGDAVAAYLFATNRLASTAVNSNESLYTIAALNDSAGTGITSTAGTGAYSGHQGIDVSLISPITVETDFNGIYDVSTNPTPASAGEILFNRAATPGLSDQVFTPTGGVANSDGVTAANVHGADANAFLMGYNGTTWDRVKAISGALAVGGNVADGASDAGDPLKVGSRALSGALSAIGASGDRADLISDMYRRTFVMTAPQVGNKITQTTVGTSAVKIVASNMAGRTQLFLQNNSNHPIYIGVDNTVTADATSTGGMIIPGHGGTLDMPSGDGITWWAISDTAAQKLIVVEMG